MVLVAQRIHRLPEAAVMKCAQLIVLGKPLQRILLERRRVARNVFAHLRRQHEEAAVDPLPVACRLLLEIDNRIASITSEPKRPAGCTAVSVASRPCCLWNSIDRGDIDIGHAIAIGQAERFLIADVRKNPLDAAAGLRLAAGVDQSHAPRLAEVLVHLHAVLLQDQR